MHRTSIKKAAFFLFILIVLTSLNAETSETVLLINEAEDDVADMLEEHTGTIKREIDKNDFSSFLFFESDRFFVQSHQVSHYLDYATERRIPFVILNIYSLEDENLKIVSTVYSLPSGSEILSLSSVGNLDLGIDRKISFIFSRALRAVEQTEAEEFPQTSAELSENEEITVPPKPPEIVSSEDQSVKRSDLGTVNPVLSLGGFSMIPIFVSSEYLGPGGGAEVFFGLSFPFRRSAFETGISLSWRGFYAEGTYNRTFNSPVTIQAEASLVFLVERAFSPFAGVSAGVTIYNMETVTGLWVSKILPAFSVITGLSWNISDLFAVYAGASMSLWIESSLLITAVEPLAGIRLSF